MVDSKFASERDTNNCREMGDVDDIHTSIWYLSECPNLIQVYPLKNCYNYNDHYAKQKKQHWATRYLCGEEHHIFQAILIYYSRKR